MIFPKSAALEADLGCGRSLVGLWWHPAPEADHETEQIKELQVVDRLFSEAPICVAVCSESSPVRQPAFTFRLKMLDEFGIQTIGIGFRIQRPEPQKMTRNEISGQRP